MTTFDIKSIPQKQQRYLTIGDWFKTPEGTWRIRVSELGDWRMEAVTALHELVELILCIEAGITEDEVDHFDFNYQGKYDEPGDDPKAPYHHQHAMATAIERMVAAELNIDWKEYDHRVNECLKPDSTSSPNKETEPDSPSV